MPTVSSISKTSFSQSTDAQVSFTPSPETQTSYTSVAATSFNTSTVFHTDSPFTANSEPPSFSSFESQYSSCVSGDYVMEETGGGGGEYSCAYRAQPAFDHFATTATICPSTVDVCSSALYLDLEETWNQVGNLFINYF